MTRTLAAFTAGASVALLATGIALIVGTRQLRKRIPI